jgi:hypothetical protein
MIDFQSKFGRVFSPKGLRWLRFLGVIVLVTLPVYLITKMVITSNRKPLTTASSGNNTAEVLGSQTTSEINYTFSDPISKIKNKEGNLPSLTFVVQNAEKRNEILVQGKKATAVEGRTFLILNIKVTNPNSEGYKINTRNYFRLATGGNQTEWLAPDIHNDPVEVQAISTKFTRVGFPINLSDNNLVLQVGKVDGDKQQLPLNF